jgi:2-amino-4-hydroxy-6-hydroxymethyldihydropteridine diphosphokinase
MKMSFVYIGLGSNLGDRLNYLKNAVEEIKNLKDTGLLISSSVYETEPWGNSEQDLFLNAVILIETSLKPEELLRQLKNIESKIGRKRKDKWAAREIDIDILFYDNEVIINENMKIPHPQIENRRFVLVPLNEIASDLIHPELNKNITTLLKETANSLSVIKYSDKLF